MMMMWSSRLPRSLTGVLRIRVAHVPISVSFFSRKGRSSLEAARAFSCSFRSSSSAKSLAAQRLPRTSSSKGDDGRHTCCWEGLVVVTGILIATTGIFRPDSLGKTHLETASIVSNNEDTLTKTEVTSEGLKSSSNNDEEEAAHNDDDDDDDTTTLLNWSGTHAVHLTNSDYFEPETIEELKDIVKTCHEREKPMRPLGSALSPNGIGFQPGGMVSLSNLDRIVNVDKQNMRVTVQAGARVSQVVDALRPYGLTLPNLASISEQQMGGFIQVGAHGTGARIAPVDEYVEKLKLVTPARGIVELTAADGELFHLAKVGLGCLGIVAEVTMQCIPAHRLVEHTFVLTRAEATAQLNSLLESHKHVRYMWIPYQDAVVVVTNDPEEDVARNIPRDTIAKEDVVRPLRDLLVEVTAGKPEPFTEESTEGMGFGELRDALLAVNPLDVDHVKRCNKAEAEFWRRSSGYQTKPSDQLLQFDCGGQQWVWEVCFPTGTSYQSNGDDMKFMEQLLAGIEEKGIAAPSPIEQRWSTSSSSLMSPAHGPPGALHSWVGIIMYLPLEDEMQRRQITERFRGQYCDLLRSVGSNVNAASHWAKLELPNTVWELLDLQESMQSRYPVNLFNAARASFDPKNLLGNNLINLSIGPPQSKPYSGRSN